VHQVTFTSDFGLSDPYVGEVKGVLTAIAPEARIIDLTHDIEPGNLVQASFTLSKSFRYFADGTLHLVVVDPGVGTTRGIVAVRTSRFTFVGPDNGVLWEAVQRDLPGRIAVLEPAKLYVELQKRCPGNPVVARLVEGGMSATFHGRDLFAPLAAYICEGHPLEAVASPGKALEKLLLPAPVRTEQSVAGRVLYIDRFGNLVTNIGRDLVESNDEVFIKARNELVLVGGLSDTYAQVETGKPLALIGSRNNLEIAVNRGSARDLFETGCGAEILVMKGTREQ
jgi:S-adenosylmethionine hydrolase